MATYLIDMIIWKVPNRRPSDWMSPALATLGMSRETKAPLQKPYASAKIMRPAWLGW